VVPKKVLGNRRGGEVAEVGTGGKIIGRHYVTQTFEKSKKARRKNERREDKRTPCSPGIEDLKENGVMRTFSI